MDQISKKCWLFFMIYLFTGNRIPSGVCKKPATNPKIIRWPIDNLAKQWKRPFELVTIFKVSYHYQVVLKKLDVHCPSSRYLLLKSKVKALPKNNSFLEVVKQKQAMLSNSTLGLQIIRCNINRQFWGDWTRFMFCDWQGIPMSQPTLRLTASQNDIPQKRNL